MNVPTGGFPVDIVLFAMIAVFLILRLRSVLGRRTGFEQPVPPARPAARAPVIEGRAEPTPPATQRGIPEPSTEAGRGLAAIAAADRGFDASRFLLGAEQAFRAIVADFAAGRREKLRALLTPPVFAAFEASIAEREAAGQTQHAEIRQIGQTAIERASLAADADGTRRAEITVRFASDQVSYVAGKDGQLAVGTDAVTEMLDLWTFARDLARDERTWRLADARSA